MSAWTRCLQCGAHTGYGDDYCDACGYDDSLAWHEMQEAREEPERVAAGDGR